VIMFKANNWIRLNEKKYYKGEKIPKGNFTQYGHYSKHGT
jgi:hypothetical protein